MIRSFLTLTCSITLLQLHAQVPANGRRIGYLMNTAEDGNTGAALGLAEAACVEGAHKTILWSAVQPAIGTWDAGQLMALDMLNLQSAVQSVPRSLQIAVTNTARNEVPAELNGYPYDHPAMVAAFTVFLDTLFAHIPDMPLVYLNIGMESDIMWGGDALQYQRFGAFLAQVIPHAKQRYQALHGMDLSVGTTMTWAGLTNPVSAALCQGLNAPLDHISLTYYGVVFGFTVKPPAQVIADFDALMALYPGTKPVMVQECGYPTSPFNASSEALQSAFISAMFTAWDNHWTRIPYLSVSMLTDVDSTTALDLAAYYGLTTTPYVEFHRTLGLRTWPGSGALKPAYETLLCELRDRGFCTTTCTASMPEGPDTDEPPFHLILDRTAGTVRVQVERGPVRRVSVHAVDGRMVARGRSGEPLSIEGLSPGVHVLHVEGLGVRRFVLD